MKKLIIAFLILGVAAPAAWGLYSTRGPQREAPAPAGVAGGDFSEAMPLMDPMDRLNDWAISLKRRIKAYIYRDQRATTEGWAKQCLPRIGNGLYSRISRMGGDAVTTVAGTVYNVSDTGRAPAAYRVKLYGKSGKVIGAGETRLGEIKAHSARSFRTVLRVPGARVAGVKLELDSAVAHH